MEQHRGGERRVEAVEVAGPADSAGRAGLPGPAPRSKATMRTSVRYEGSESGPEGSRRDHLGARADQRQPGGRGEIGDGRRHHQPGERQQGGELRRGEPGGAPAAGGQGGERRGGPRRGGGRRSTTPPGSAAPRRRIRDRPAPRPASRRGAIPAGRRRPRGPARAPAPSSGPRQARALRSTRFQPPAGEQGGGEREPEEELLGIAHQPVGQRHQGVAAEGAGPGEDQPGRAPSSAQPRARRAPARASQRPTIAEVEGEDVGQPRLLVPRPVAPLAEVPGVAEREGDDRAPAAAPARDGSGRRPTAAAPSAPREVKPRMRAVATSCGRAISRPVVADRRSVVRAPRRQTVALEGDEQQRRRSRAAAVTGSPARRAMPQARPPRAIPRRPPRTAPRSTSGHQAETASRL